MENLAPILSILPPAWRDASLAAIGALIALRTALYALVRACHAVDMSDGREDWLWVAKLGYRLQWLDRHVLSRLPVKAPFVRDTR